MREAADFRFCPCGADRHEIANGTEHNDGCKHREDRWRWCVYCEVDCLGHPSDGEPFLSSPFEGVHANDCPSVLGIYPVWRCDIEPHGLVCTVCDAPLIVGAAYACIRIDEDLVEITCVGCAVIGVPS